MPTISSKDAILLAISGANKEGLSAEEVARALPGLPLAYARDALIQMEHAGFVVSALVDGIEPPKRLYHLVRKK